MILFLLLAVSLALVAAVVLVVAVRRARTIDVDRARVNVAIFRERKAELDADLAAGRIGTDQHAALLGELERMLVDDVEGSAPALTAAYVPSRTLSVALLVLVPLLSIALYVATGFDADTRDWLELEARSDELAALPQPLTAESVAGSGLSLTDAARLTQANLRFNPAEAERWFNLGITWLELDSPLGVDALRTAQRLAPERLDYAITLARVDLALNGGRLTEESRALLDGVLAREPAHQGVLMVYGAAAFESGDYALAVQHWGALLAQIDPQSEGAGMLRRSIAVASERAAKVASGSGAIPVRVSLAPTIGAVPDNATLFVIVRAAGGPPMPIAAKKLSPALPVEVTLTDADQMMPGAPLAERGPLEVRARLSLSGTPMPGPGDIESAPVPVSFPVDAPVTLLLDRRVP